MQEQQIKLKIFKGYEAIVDEMLEWLNSENIKGNIITISQAKNNDFCIFYWG